MTNATETYRVGQVVTFYPRAGRPGHEVEIVDLRPHPLHRMIITFRYPKDGRTQSRTWGKFFTSPE